MNAPTEPAVNVATGTVNFTRKVSVREYESAEASIFVQFDIPTDPSLTAEERGAAVIANARDAFFQAKALVYEQLGLEFSVDNDGVLMEVVRCTFPGVTEVHEAKPATTPTSNITPITDAPTAQQLASTPPYDSRTSDRDEKNANQDWAKARYQLFPSEFFDNRPKKASGEFKSTSPDLKHKDSGVGIWL